MTILKENKIGDTNIWTATDGKVYRIFINDRLSAETADIDAAVTIHQMAIAIEGMRQAR
jgi:hypothetical protein